MAHRERENVREREPSSRAERGEDSVRELQRKST